MAQDEHASSDRVRRGPPREKSVDYNEDPSDDDSSIDDTDLEKEAYKPRWGATSIYN